MGCGVEFGVCVLPKRGGNLSKKTGALMKIKRRLQNLVEVIGIEPTT